MLIRTKAFGEINITPEEIIDFPEGLLGFEEYKKFVILVKEGEGPFKWLQAIDEEKLAFILIDPLDFRPGYTLDIAPADLSFLKAESVKGLLCFGIVVVPEDPMQMTANLQGPVVINPEKKIARQCISLNQSYKTRHFILEEMKQLPQAKEDAGKTAGGGKK